MGLSKIRVINKVTIVIFTLLTKSHDPPSSVDELRGSGFRV